MNKNKIVAYEKGHLEDLRDPKEAELYLNAALDDDDPRVFVQALGEVVKAIGISKVSKGTSLNRGHLYEMLSEKGNPELVSLHKILRVAGFKLNIHALPIAA